jgi:hypothetical protein
MCDFYHVGVLCTGTISNRAAPDQGKRCGRPSRTGTESHSAGSISSSQPGGPPCWDSPLAFSLIGLHRQYTVYNYINECMKGSVFSFYEEHKQIMALQRKENIHRILYRTASWYQVY